MDLSYFSTRSTTEFYFSHIQSDSDGGVNNDDNNNYNNNIIIIIIIIQTVV